ncbi:unnamed protein product, partial [Rotaria magnacalcarata]
MSIEKQNEMYTTEIETDNFLELAEQRLNNNNNNNRYILLRDLIEQKKKSNKSQLKNSA